MKKDLVGIRFGFFVVISPVSGYRELRWLCRCDCGNDRIIPTGAVVRGSRISCGCIFKIPENTSNYKHGKSKTSLYEIWVNMRRRCKSNHPKFFPHYKSRGIAVCSEWDTYLIFEKWSLENGYSLGLSIDRKDVNKGCYPDNCRWIPFEKQLRNQTNSRMATINGVTKHIYDWCEMVDFPLYMVSNRFRRGIRDEALFHSYRNNRGEMVHVDTLSKIKAAV